MSERGLFYIKVTLAISVGACLAIFKIPQVRVLGRSKFYNKMVTQKGDARVPKCMAENDFVKGPSL